MTDTPPTPVRRRRNRLRDPLRRAAIAAAETKALIDALDETGAGHIILWGGRRLVSQVLFDAATARLVGASRRSARGCGTA